MIVDWNSAERLQCSRKEKEQVIDLVDLLVKASEKSRTEGLLSLEDDLEEYGDPLLKVGMRLVVDGTDPEIIDEILSARIFAENKKGKEFLEQILIATGVKSVQAGNSPRNLMERLFPFFGSESDDLRDEYLSNVVSGREDGMLEEFNSTDGAFAAQFESLQKLIHFENRAIQKLLRELDMFELSRILAGANSGLRRKITTNMSRRAAIAAVESVIGGVAVENVRVSVTKLFSLIEKLQELGEIAAPST